MIGPGTGVRVYLACGVTDMRKGIAGLSALAQDVLRQKPAGGAVFAFRGRRGDRLKLLYWDGQGFCLYYKVLERGRFPWPNASDGSARLGRNPINPLKFNYSCDSLSKGTREVAHGE
jgi:transposase